MLRDVLKNGVLEFVGNSLENTRGGVHFEKTLEIFSLSVSKNTKHYSCIITDIKQNQKAKQKKKFWGRWCRFVLVVTYNIYAPHSYYDRH